ncbi:MAG: UDP-N-acetylmuramoyl-L-alanyl-D-glutamate--2,6-diaminopimelate ligase [Fimbriimonadaceae bacterium]|nr:UDP-N-acetylmuramoyl-L-alanyl-D-glutamate--2,6-diaminopimelate ligase [Fimbriimonadaceae bacterium]
MTVSDLFDLCGLQSVKVFNDAEVTSVCSDSRQVQPGAVFVCMPSENSDTHAFALDAVKRGAVGVVAHSREGRDELIRQRITCGWVPEEEFNYMLGGLCDAALDHPASELSIIGVTGTNGKSTTAWMIRDALEALGTKAAYLGTLGFRYPGHVRVLENTTPFPVELWNLFKDAADAGCEYFVMETSSHALSQGRVARVPFGCGVFTNLSQDHLDFHGSMEDYELSKLTLFTDYACDGLQDFAAVINVDDPVGQGWVSTLEGMEAVMGDYDEDLKDQMVEGALEALRLQFESSGQKFDKNQAQQVETELRAELDSDGPREYALMTYGFERGGFKGRATRIELDSLELELKFEGATAIGAMKVGGEFNAFNALSAAASLCAIGFELTDVAKALGSVTPVPGRFESIQNDRGIGVIVDYAHTPDALEKLLKSARPLTKGRLIAVFGCGGDRDRSKRPLMANVVSEMADLAVVTSDNPRTEDPEAIIREVQSGLKPGTPTETVVDRREAIRLAIQLAQPGDTVVIAGKGHEDYQIIGKTKHHMDDREMAREALV